MNKAWWKAAGIRAVKTIAQTLASMIPAGYVVTPAIINSLNWSTAEVVVAWLATGLLAGVTSILTSVAGLPEVDNAKVYRRNE